MKIIAAAKPKWGQSRVQFELEKSKIDTPIAILGVRGYYRDTLGAVGRNDRGIYDDAIFVNSEDVFASFNANVDPSIFKPGIAQLQPGIYSYKLGIHGLSKPIAVRYQALVQAGPVSIKRDEGGLEKGYFGINIHRGGNKTTSSAGCQTIYSPQWDAFIVLVRSEMKRQGIKTLPYLLIETAG